jgi:hypothetical protein
LVALLSGAACKKDDAASETAAAAEKAGAPADKDAPAANAPAAAPAPAPHSRSLASGVALDLRSAVTITSRRNKIGDTVTAAAGSAALSATGDVVIPAGAEFVGTITAIAPAENAGGHGTLSVAFSQVRFGGRSYPVQVTVNSMGTTMVGRGITAGDAGKVGAGAAVGAVAGRIIGGNRTGTAVGAVAGAAAGTAVAVQTRDTDITLQTGAAVRVTLSQPFNRSAPTTN